MQNISPHKYMEKLDLTWSDDSIRFINTAHPERARLFSMCRKWGISVLPSPISLKEKT